MRHTNRQFFGVAIRGLLIASSVFAGLIDQSYGQQSQDRGEPTQPTDASRAVSTFHVADLDWRQVLSEPTITQPLSIAFDDHERMWLVEYRQYPEPAGLKQQSRDVHWRIVYDKTPMAPGRGGIPGIDRISVHEDLDRDGTYEKHHVFLDDLNIATSVVPVPGGAWVLNPPYLLFYHDRDQDLKADGPPDIHLEGFGLEDTHSVVNSLSLGPDGWLYGAQGSTVTGSVRSYGTGDVPIKSLGQAIWRYHPVTHRYEIFAEGGGNAFGVAFDDHGDIFSGHNGGDTRGFHYVQGGYYRKGFTKHGGLSNPYTFGYLNPMKHDPIQRFTHAMFMLDASWQRGEHKDDTTMFCIDPLHGKVIHTHLQPIGSTYQTNDVGDVVSSDDKWFRPVAIHQGPDGALYICDWYDFQVAHIYAHVGQLDRERGRVYRLSTESNVSNRPSSPVGSLSMERWVEDLDSPIRWQRDRARRMIVQSVNDQTRSSPELEKSLLISKLKTANNSPPSYPVEYLWALHGCGWIPDTIPHRIRFASSPRAPEEYKDWLEWFHHPNPDVRRWLIRLVCDDGHVEPETLSKITELATKERDIHVLGQIASSARRLPAGDALLLISSLLSQQIDASDLFLPPLIWWAIEQHAKEETLVTQNLLGARDARNENWLATFLLPKLVERWAIVADKESFEAIEKCLQFIDSIRDSSLRSEASRLAIEAFERAFQNRSIKSVPKSVLLAMSELGVPTLTLSIRQEDPEAIQKGIEKIRDAKTPLSLRTALIQLAGEMKIEAFLNPLLELVREEVARKDKANEKLIQVCLSALAAFDRPEIAATILDQWSLLSPNARSVAGATLARRAAWVQEWIARCKSGSIDPKSLPIDAQRAMLWIENESLQQELARLYPSLSNMSLAVANQEAERIIKIVDAEQGDPYRGKRLYRTHCGRCHRLFDDGGSIGPDLTGYQRDQAATLIRNIVAPSLEIREGYQAWTLVLMEGNVVTGFLESETDELLVIKGIDGQSQTVAKEDIEMRKPQSLSIMPERLLESLAPSEISDLMAYLRSTQPIMEQ